jgi:integrase
MEQAAGLPKRCTLHGLRAAGATYLAEKRKATAHQIMGWSGWTSIKQVMVYTKRVDKRRLGEDAVDLFDASPAPVQLRRVK